MSDINALELHEEDAPEVDVTGELPSQFGSFSRPPQPGTYTFKLPAKEVLAKAFDVEDRNDNGSIIRVVKVDFSGPAKLQVLGGGTFETRLSTYGVPRGKDKIKVSDITYLLQALGHDKPVKGHKGQALALVEHGGEYFDADVNWFAGCKEDKDIYVQTEEGTKKQEGKKGCGAQYAPETYTTKNNVTVMSIPKDEHGEFADRFECRCGASVRVFASLRNFQPSKSA